MQAEQPGYQRIIEKWDMNSTIANGITADAEGKIRISDVVAALKELRREVSCTTAMMVGPENRKTYQRKKSLCDEKKDARVPLKLISNPYQPHSTGSQILNSTGLASNAPKQQETGIKETISFEQQQNQQPGLQSLLPQNTSLPEIEELHEIINLLDKMEA